MFILTGLNTDKVVDYGLSCVLTSSVSSKMSETTDQYLLACAIWKGLADR